MHDQGSLPAPREGGNMAKLIACVQQAKLANDKYLTQLIENEKKGKVVAQHQDKKAKLSSDR